MTVPIGVSSGSAPDLSAGELAHLVRAHGGDVVDLRAGAGHRWEAAGVDAFAASGLRIAFIGVDLVLGRPVGPFGSGSAQRWVDSGLPLKVKAAAGCSADDLADSQIARLVAALGDPALLLVETHAGGAGVDELLELAGRHGIRVCLDLLGLALIHVRPHDAMDRMAGHIGAVQVKGFDWDSPRPGVHRPLAALPGAVLDHVLEIVAGTDRPVTIESHAGVLGDDIARLKGAAERIGDGTSRCGSR